MEDSLLGGVSRSGRVRKKSSKLADFESPDEIEKPIVKKKPIKELIPSAHPVESKSKIESALTDLANSPPHQPQDLEDEDDASSTLPMDEARRSGTKRKRSPSEADKAKAGSPFLMWGKSRRRELAAQNPGWSQAELARQLWAQWQNLPETEKQAVQGQTEALDEAPATKKKRSPVSSTGSPSANNAVPLSSSSGCPAITPGTDVLDSAAHLKLLGESLTVIGERLTKHVGQIVLAGSLSVLMDSLLCALGPLMCLTQHVPELNAVPPEQLKQILDNVAYIMPGL